MTVREQPWLKPARHLLPYTSMRIVNGTLETCLDEAAYTADLQDTRLLPTDELKELWYRYREMVVEYSELEGAEDSLAVAEIRVEQYATELKRRKRIAESGHPVAPPWDRSRRDDLTPRIRAVKDAWPIARMVTELMGLQLDRTSNRARLKGLCPLHEERTPSFHVNTEKNTFHCFGCGESGDVIDLAGYQFGLTRPIDKIEALERWAGIGISA